MCCSPNTVRFSLTFNDCDDMSQCLQRMNSMVTKELLTDMLYNKKLYAFDAETVGEVMALTVGDKLAELINKAMGLK